MIGPKDACYEKVHEEFLPRMPGPTKGDKIVQFNRLFNEMWEAMRGSFWAMNTTPEGQPADKVIATFEEEEVFD